MTATAAVTAPAAAGVAGEHPTADTSVTCPDVVTLVARGSEENDLTEPGEANGYSNGHEGESINRFLSYASSVHPGLFDAVHRPVLAVDAERYPARFPVGEAGEDPDLAVIADGVRLFIDSMARGLPGGVETVVDYERATGCSPDYVGIGYSQGVAVLGPVQHMLAADGRLRGSVYFGNPAHHTPEILSVGALAGLPVHSYCVTDDFVCDTNIRTVAIALGDDQDAGPHARYFQDAASDPASATAEERAAADALAALVH